MSKVVAIMIGGAIGAVVRYLVTLSSTRVFGSGFAWGTLFVNVAGCLMIGFALGIAQVRGMDEHLRLFFVTGFLGALTTFSTYSFETVQHARDGAIMASAVNIMANNVLGFAATYAGYFMAIRMN